MAKIPDLTSPGEVDQPKSFQARLMDKIHDQIPDLISPDELRKVIERGVEKALFEPRVEFRAYGNQVIRPSFAEEVVDRHLKEQVKAAMDTWILANQDRFGQMVQDALAKGILNLAMSHLEAKLTDAMLAGIDRLRQDGQLAPHGTHH